MRLLLLLVTVGVAPLAVWGGPPLQNDLEALPYLRQHSSSRNYLLDKDNFESRSEVGSKFKLNDTFIPQTYEVKLLVILDDEPDIGEQFTAPGSVRISISPTQDTSTIILHANLLSIKDDSISVTRVSEPEVEIEVTGVSNDTISGRHYLIIDVGETLENGTLYSLYIEFIAPVSTDRTNGLYLSTDINQATGEQRRQAGTQMESYHLRQLFPNFDEPALKATFDVEITRKDNYTSLANSNLISSTPDSTRPGWTIDKFAITPHPMSPYLYVMVVSDFPYVESTGGSNPIPVRVYGPSELIARGGGNYTVELTADLLTKFDEYYNTTYPYPKLDSVALPVKGGAMENWGLILYRWDLLIYVPGVNTERERYSITDVIAHEVAHQNFGDLVTCAWWSVLWLNEGFATYVEHLGVDLTYPEFRARERMVNDIVQSSMVEDAGVSSYPMTNEAALTPSEIDAMFGGITYEKGGSIIRMVENFLTEPTLQKGLIYYLEEMKFKAAQPGDLFRNLQIAVDEDGSALPLGVTVKDVLDTWTLQKGFPLVKVTISNGNSVIISQERFRNDSALERDSKQLDPSDLWFVPITVITEGNSTRDNYVPDVWLEKREIAISYPHNTSTWIMLNQDATGYFRTLYDTTLTSLIEKQLEVNASVISPLSRSQLLDDYFTFAFTGRIPIESALSLTRYLLEEDHFSVWQVIFTQLRTTYNFFAATPESYAAFKNYFLPRIEAALIAANADPQKIGMSAIHQERVFDWACSLESPSCREYSLELFNAWQETPETNPIPVELRSVVSCAIVAFEGESGFDFVLERYKEEFVGPLSQRPKLLNALACATEPEIVQGLLNLTLESGSGINGSDRVTLLQRVGMNSKGRSVLLQFLNDRLAEVISVVGAGSLDPVQSVVTTLSEYYNKQEELIAFETFLEDNLDILVPIAPEINRAVGRIQNNIGWMNSFGQSIFEWLSLQ